MGQLTEDYDLFVPDNIDIQFELDEIKDSNAEEVEDNEIEASEESRCKVIRAVQRLGASYNPLSSKYLDQLRDSEKVPEKVNQVID